MLRCASRLVPSSVLLAILALGPYGAGALMTCIEPDACASEGCDDCEEDAGDEEGCPPFCQHCLDCDGCSCSPLGAIAISAPLTIDGSSPIAVLAVYDLVTSAPDGERASVFRPPRA